MAKKRDTILLHLCLEHPKPSSHKQVWSHKCTSASFLLIFDTTLLLSSGVCERVFSCFFVQLVEVHYVLFVVVQLLHFFLCSGVVGPTLLVGSSLQLFNCSTLSLNLPLKKNKRSCVRPSSTKTNTDMARARSIQCSLKVCVVILSRAPLRASFLFAGLAA